MAKNWHAVERPIEIFRAGAVILVVAKELVAGLVARRVEMCLFSGHGVPAGNSELKTRLQITHVKQLASKQTKYYASETLGGCSGQLQT